MKIAIEREEKENRKKVERAEELRKARKINGSLGVDENEVMDIGKRYHEKENFGLISTPWPVLQRDGWTRQIAKGNRDLQPYLA